MEEVYTREIYRIHPLLKYIQNGIRPWTTFCIYLSFANSFSVGLSCKLILFFSAKLFFSNKNCMTGLIFFFPYSYLLHNNENFYKFIYIIFIYFINLCKIQSLKLQLLQTPKTRTN